MSDTNPYDNHPPRGASIRLVLSLLVLVGVAGVVQAQKYDSQGKRDPFVPLRTAVKEVVAAPAAPPPLDQRPPGLPGLLISEVTVAGTAGSERERLVILKGIDKATYLARAGSKLYDGALVSITDQEVIFTRETTDVRGKKKTTKVVKRLYTEEK